MREIVIVGAGITAAAAAAVLKREFKVTVYEIRDHLGGNCYDYYSQGTYVHRYGAHVYHNPNAELHKWLSSFTAWRSYRHSVTAEILLGDQPTHVPFPYSHDTEKVIGPLADPEIIEMFFRGYSEKMWGVSWDALPTGIRNRVPKRQVVSDFFMGQYTALPERGYTSMIKEMFRGCDLVLGCAPQTWRQHPVKPYKVLYCGRLDLLRDANGFPLGSTFVDRQQLHMAWLPHRTLEFTWSVGAPVSPTAVLNYCHLKNPAIRRIQHAQLTGGDSQVFHLETPKTAHVSDPSPFYPAPRTDAIGRSLEVLEQHAKTLYPDLIPMGRLAQSLYLDMHQAVGKGKAVGESILSGACDFLET